MKLLAFDTSSESCSAALLLDDTLYSECVVQPRQQAKVILPIIDGLLRQAHIKIAHLQAIAYVNGPGSFTGIRLASGIAQGLAYPNDTPIIEITSLKAIAYRVWQEQADVGEVLVIIDAKMKEVYWGWFNLENGQVIGQCELSSIEVIPKPKTDACVVAGSKAEITWYSEKHAVQPRNRIELPYPQATDVVALASYDYQQGLLKTAMTCEPMYLRQAVV